jgi:hypothetical protein
MKKIIPIVISVLTMCAAAGTARAQSFSIDKDTVHYVVYGSAEPKTKVNNLTSADLDIEWKITYQNVSPEFLTNSGINICDKNTCWTVKKLSDVPTVRQVKMNAGEKMDMKMMPSLEDVPGTGTPWYVTVTITDPATSYNKNLTFAITKWATNVAETAKTPGNISMYPNPANNELNVVFDPEMSVKNITVYNLIGKAVTVYKTTSNTSAKLNIENIPSGVYFIRLSDNQGRVVANRKFTKQ